MSPKSKLQYACAVLLIVSSIALAFIQEYHINEITNGVLMYIAQAFLLAGSIFGLEYYITKLNKFINENSNSDTRSVGTRKHSSP